MKNRVRRFSSFTLLAMLVAANVGCAELVKQQLPVEPSPSVPTGSVSVTYGKASEPVITGEDGKALEWSSIDELFKKGEKIVNLQSLSIITTSGSPCYRYVCDGKRCIKQLMSLDGCP